MDPNSVYYSEIAQDDVKNEDTALFMSAYRKDIFMMEILLALSLSLNRSLNLNLQNKYNQTVLHICVQNNNVDMVTLLLLYGADRTIKNSEDKTPIDLVDQKDVFGNERSNGNCCYHILKNYFPTDNQYNKQSIEARVRDKVSKLKEQYIQFIGSDTIYPKLKDMIKIFYKNNFSTVDIRNNDRETALMIQSKYGSIEVIEWLLEQKASINLQDSQGFTALMHAVHSGNLNKVVLLLQNAADQNIKSRNNETPLDWAKRNQASNQIISLFERNLQSSDKQKYLKYKAKYLELKEKIN
jgi:ankyrin repeat protein